MQDKLYYNRKHHLQYFRTGDWALLRLYKGYNIPANKLTGRKYSQQIAGLFKVIERIGRLAYQLAVPEDWTIYNIFSVAQLELYPPPDQDLYQRSRPTSPGPVETERDNLDPEYELERMLDKRIIRKGKGQAIKYLVRQQGQQGQGTNYDRYLNARNISAEELIKVYEDRRTLVPVRKSRKASTY